MEHPLSDTDPETERVHLRLMRQATPGRRMRLALSLSQSVMSLSRAGLARRFPDASDEELGLRNEVSALQWTDVLGVVMGVGDGLDLPYLRRGAAELGVADLLERALTEAGDSNSADPG